VAARGSCNLAAVAVRLDPDGDRHRGTGRHGRDGCATEKGAGSGGPASASGAGAVTTALTVPAVQALTFVLGCAVIHAARGQADRVTRLLVTVAVAAAVSVLLVASLDYAPEADATFDEVSGYAAP
jgi:hypothetical protein